MRFGRKIDDDVGEKIGKQAIDQRRIADIAAGERKTRMRGNCLQRSHLAGISELVQNMELMLAVADQVANQRRTDEARAARD